MSNADQVSLFPERLPALLRGEDKVVALLSSNRRSIPAGSMLVTAGDEQPFACRVQQGWFARLRELPDGRSQYIQLFLPGDLFALDSMFMNVHPDSIVALSDGVVQQIEHTKLRDACETDADIAVRCTWQVLEDAGRLQSWMVCLARGSAENRLAMFITDVRDRLAISNAIDFDASEFHLPMTQSQLGEYLGLSAVHTNRALKSMRDNGITTLRNKHIIIHDLSALVRLACSLRRCETRRVSAHGYREPGLQEHGTYR